MTQGRDFQQEFRSLIRSDLDALYRTALRMLHESHEAEDAVQESLDRAWRKLDQLDADARMKPWLFRILVNFCLDRLRAKGRQQTIPYEPETMLAEKGQEDVRSPYDELANKELGGSIAAEIKRLGHEQQTVVQLIIVEGLSYEDAARALDLPVGTVRSRLSRARAQLRDALGNMLEGNGQPNGDRPNPHLRLVN